MKCSSTGRLSGIVLGDKICQRISNLKLSHKNTEAAVCLNVMNSFNLLEQLSRPLTCVGCCNYHGVRYRNQQLICSIHPYGHNELTNCPDFVAYFVDMESIVQVIKEIQPDVEILQQSDTRVTLKGKFVSRTGTDDIEYFTPLRLMSASFSGEKEHCTYVLPKQ